MRGEFSQPKGTDSSRLCQKYCEPVRPYALRYYETVVKKNAEERKAA